MPEISTTIHAKRREAQGKGPAHRLRAQGLAPAVVYSRHGQPLAITVDPKELRAALSGEARFNTLLTLKVEGDGAERLVMLKDHQRDPIKSDRLIHADFLEVRMEEKIRVEIPVVLKGKPIGVTEGGILQQSRRFLEVHCFPNKIPKEIEVDVSNLKIAQSIHVSELKMPEGVEVKFQSNYTIAVVAVPEKEEVVAPVAAPTAEGAAAAAAGSATGAAPAPGQAPAQGAAPAATAGKGGEGKGGGKEKK